MKCFVCKFIHAVEESRRHPNATTVNTARLLNQRRLEARKRKDVVHLCEQHKDPNRQSEDLKQVFRVTKLRFQPKIVPTPTTPTTKTKEAK